MIERKPLIRGVLWLNLMGIIALIVPPVAETKGFTGIPYALQPTLSQNGMKFVAIKPGSYLMGGKTEGTIHKVTLTHAFYLQTTEVTQAQWKSVMGNNPSFFKGEQLPVEQVSWNDTQTFIQKLNHRQQGKYRLPTEAEWEYAARAGSTTTYACGHDAGCLGKMGWYEPNAAKQTHPVGQKSPNKWGLYDMHGNVWEWVQDWSANYSPATAKDPMGPRTGTSRVGRGGSFYGNAALNSSAIRFSGAPDFSFPDLGFRLVKEL